MPESIINPDDYVITRKRKKYRFAKFALSSLCFEFEQWKRRHVDVIEVGAGDGLFSVELATLHPEKTFLALDVKGDRLQKGAYEAEELGLSNISFIRARADQIDQLVSAHSVQSIWVTFPDPFPKKGSSGRRLIHPTFLKLYEKILRPKGELSLKHDNREFFHWSLEQLVAESWCIETLSFDLHESQSRNEAQILTTYEKRWLDDGLSINYLRVSPEHRSSRN